MFSRIFLTGSGMVVMGLGVCGLALPSPILGIRPISNSKLLSGRKISATFPENYPRHAHSEWVIFSSAGFSSAAGEVGPTDEV